MGSIVALNGSICKKAGVWNMQWETGEIAAWSYCSEECGCVGVWAVFRTSCARGSWLGFSTGMPVSKTRNSSSQYGLLSRAFSVLSHLERSDSGLSRLVLGRNLELCMASCLKLRIAGPGRSRLTRALFFCILCT